MMVRKLLCERRIRALCQPLLESQSTTEVIPVASLVVTPMMIDSVSDIDTAGVDYDVQGLMLDETTMDVV